MKRFISISLIILAGVVLLASCRKRDYYDEPNDEREYAVVHYFEADYPYTIVRFDADGTFALIENLDDNFPEDNNELYGDFGLGIKIIRNNTLVENLRVEVLEYANTESEAFDDFDRYVVANYSAFQKSMKLRAPSVTIRK